MTYAWSPSAHLSFPAKEVGVLLEKIEAKEGIVTKEALVKAAPPDTPVWRYIHAHDDDAVRYCQLERARKLIQWITVVNPRTKKSLPAFVSVTNDEGGGYMNTERAAEEIDTRTFMLEEALTLLRGVRKRYEGLKELAGVWQEVERAERGLGK